MEYKISEHGDLLERTYANFINDYFKTYEDVWRLYIGNMGNDTKADMPGNSTEREVKRQIFSEYSYTVLQSIILLKRLTNENNIPQVKRNDLDELLDSQDYLLLFFSHLGRIRDNIENASLCLININTAKIISMLEEFYYMRHIIVHGKTLPIILTGTGKIFLPILSKSGNDKSRWNHKEHRWEDATYLPNESLEVSVTQLFFQLVAKVSEIFGLFRDSIRAELNENNLELKFDRSHEITINAASSISGSFGSSGSANQNIQSIYGVNSNK